MRASSISITSTVIFPTLHTPQSHQAMRRVRLPPQHPWAPDLELRVPLHSVWIQAISRVVWADGGLHVSHAPGLRTQYSEEGGGIHGPCPHLRLGG